MQAQNSLKFLVDRTAGRLARWLRILGFDVEYVAASDPSAIVRLARQSARTTLTRNSSLAERLGKDSMLLESERVDDQIKQVIDEVGAGRCEPFSRCNVCNAKLVPVRKDSLKGRVPEYVYMNNDRFSVCPVCGRYYWQGTHWQRMRQVIERILGDE